MVGGLSIQNEEVSINSFGATVTASIAHIFNPQNLEDRVNIVNNAYVPSSRRERYIEPIDRIIRAAQPISATKAQVIEDTSKPKELITKLSARKSLEHKVLLIVGSVGSGKTTFVDYLQEVAIDDALSESLVWCRLNMNNAPVNAEEIYNWLRNEIVSACRLSLPNLDFDELEVIRKLLGVEIAQFDKGVGRLYQKDSEQYNFKLAEHIESLLADSQTVANVHIRFTCGERGKLCIIVLDNCDKKTRDEQLLMFEAAQWMQQEFRCLVILPLRDETFDNHSNEPPLDTVLKDMVFRIEPPLFQHVLMKRVQLALKEMDSDGSNKLKFSLPNGFSVEYPKSDQAFYLASIIKSIFEHDRFARRLIVGLAGRNIRRALEIFLEFCCSGYIGDDQIFKIRQSEGNYALPFRQVATVILRMNRRYYDSDESYIKNLFSSEMSDTFPSHFSRYLVLGWLKKNAKNVGPSRLPGYFSIKQIKQSLVPLGLSPEILDRELNILLKARCLIAEHFREDSVADDDLVKIGPSGYVHLELVGNVSYLAAVAEDTFFEDREQAERISNQITDPGSQLHRNSVLNISQELLTMLEKVRKGISPENGEYLEGDHASDILDLTDAKEAISQYSKANLRDPWFSANNRLKRGSSHVVLVTNVVQFGAFVEFNDGLSGLIHNSGFNRIKPTAGDTVEVEIIWVDAIQKKMSLKLLSIIEEDSGEPFRT